MGFTRYWEFTKLDEEDFREFSSICELLIDNMGVPLEDITINERTVRFNGVDEDGHETFVFSIDKNGFNFCKTNVKPYDEVVCGCLYVAKIIFGDVISINQDCEPEDDIHIIQKVINLLRDNKLNKILD